MSLITSTTPDTPEGGDVIIIIFVNFSITVHILHFNPAADGCTMCHILHFDIFTAVLLSLRSNCGYFQQYSLVQLSPSRRNSCLNTLSERGCVSENQKTANERRLPAHTMPLVYYWSWTLIGGEVGENRALCCVRVCIQKWEIWAFSLVILFVVNNSRSWHWYTRPPPPW